MPRWLVRWLNSIIVLKLLCRGWGVWVVVFHPKGSCTSPNIAFPLGDVYEALAHACYPPSPTVVVWAFFCATRRRQRGEGARAAALASRDRRRCSTIH